MRCRNAFMARSMLASYSASVSVVRRRTEIEEKVQRAKERMMGVSMVRLRTDGGSQTRAGTALDAFNHTASRRQCMPLPRVPPPSSLLSSFSGSLLPTFSAIMSTNDAAGVAAPLPAHKTKHISLLDYRFRHCTFRLAQLDDGNTNGTALWMGAQVLSAFLSQHLDQKHRVKGVSHPRRPRVLELGSGIGLSAYVAQSSLAHRRGSSSVSLPAILNLL